MLAVLSLSVLGVMKADRTKDNTRSSGRCCSVSVTVSAFAEDISYCDFR